MQMQQIDDNSTLKVPSPNHRFSPRDVTASHPGAAATVAIYARVSTSDGRQDADNQLLELRRFAGTQNWDVTAEYVDHESGKTAERPQFRQLFTHASQRKFNVALFWSLDRFTREGALATLQHLQRLSDYGVGFRSYAEPYLDSCGMFKDAIVGIIGTIAKQERLRISERVKAGLARAKTNGTRSGKEIGRPRVVFRRDQVSDLRSKGLSWSQIAARTGGSVGTVRRAHRAASDGAMPCQNPLSEIL